MLIFGFLTARATRGPISDKVFDLRQTKIFCKSWAKWHIWINLRNEINENVWNGLNEWKCVKMYEINEINKLYENEWKWMKMCEMYENVWNV